METIKYVILFTAYTRKCRALTTKKATLCKLVNLQRVASVGLRQKKSLKIAICHLCLT